MFKLTKKTKLLGGLIILVLTILAQATTANAALQKEGDLNLQINPIICILENINVGTTDINSVVPDMCLNLPVLCELETIDPGLAPPNQIIFKRCRIISDTTQPTEENAESSIIDDSILIITNPETTEGIDFTVDDREQLAQLDSIGQQKKINNFEKAFAGVMISVSIAYAVDAILLDLLITQRVMIILARFYAKIF